MVFYRFLIILFIVLASPHNSFAQEFSKCKSGEDSICALLKQIKNTDTDSGKLNINDKICSVFQNILFDPESFQFPFDSLQKFGKLQSPDNLFRIITWNTILSDGSNHYNGIVQVKQPKTRAIRLFVLTDRANEITNRENSVLSAGKWYGGIYYKILKNKVNQTTYYTLISLRYNNLFTTSKIIEIMYFDEFGNPVFGAPLFTDGKKTKLRIVFEYSANVAMKLNYDENRKMIVFDHLSPNDPRFVGQYDNYGPDFSYDGFEFKNNMWRLITDLDIKNPNDTKTQGIKRTPGSNRIVR
jgi:hypothetical protein